MNLSEFKALLEQADKTAQEAIEDYSNISAAHKAALQIMEFEKGIYYGDTAQSRHLQKIREIIEINSEDIVHETN